MPRGQIVVDHRMEPAPGELLAAVGADVAGPAGDEDVHMNPF